ncbi:unnamed protein product, partial [Polarella glacialis]
VVTVEVVSPLVPTGTVQLLICFKEPEGGTALRETLTYRYLINLKSTKVDDCHPVICISGDCYTLREQFCSSSGGMVANKQEVVKHVPGAIAEAFILRRCGQGPVADILRPPPETVVVSPERRRLIVGREETCAVVFRHPHVSKAHATLLLQDSPEAGASCMLLMQDSSSNGTWVNGEKMTTGRYQQLQAGDRISFLAPTFGSLDEDPTTYE